MNKICSINDGDSMLLIDARMINLERVCFFKGSFKPEGAEFQDPKGTLDLTD